MTLPPPGKLKVLLVSNYPIDRQESMQRFAQMMASGLSQRGLQVTTISPKPVLGKLFAAKHTGAKWLGYLDKFVLFVPTLLQAANEADIVHICDHSNSLYVPVVKHRPHLITCHDLLAVRAGLGEDTFVNLNPSGKVLQHLILNGLKSAGTIICDSSATAEDVKRLIDGKESSRIKIVLLGLNRKLQILTPDEIDRRLAPVAGLIRRTPFLLHVGSSLKRKNRAGVLRIFARLANDFAGQLVFCGSPLPDELRAFTRQAGLSERVIEIVEPDDPTLEALYNAAYALIFPSLSEGFGWPILEAQACGCPVICSNTSSCPEAAGGAALLRHPNDEAGFVEDILKLKDTKERQNLIALGLANAERISTEGTIERYERIYYEVLARFKSKASN
jgi:glycosyltransferase involved in cell wall biosynthesis